ncbi:hypothetical protein C1S70_07290 (plasmid) [Azospirillum argentinense]|uniref:Uncharacterized protein n=1 Tax=Azospirillum argentinense TaxID=2970906 RepID=A0A2K1G3K3_9PROT|nr:hypothetical protein [Azospirillum argentinense]PNQ99363.1 hypothetical protein C1S70_07290 [Azospirillum argentinense]
MISITHSMARPPVPIAAGLAPLRLPERHAARHREACATMAPPPAIRRIRAVRRADGRVAYPEVVRYRLYRWNEAEEAYRAAELVDLPPTVESHPDEHMRERARASRRPFLPVTLPYVADVRDLVLYERLKARGALEHGHRVAMDDGGEPIDKHAMPRG